MPTVTLTPTAVSATGSGGWATLEYYKNASHTYPLTLDLTYPTNATLSGPGVNITGITIHGYIRNMSTANKRVQFGFRPSVGAGADSWCQIDGTNVTAAAFKAIDLSYSGQTYVYNRFSKTYGGTHILTQYVRAAMQAGSPLYLGVIQPDLYRNISLSLTLSEWAIDVTYELMGNVPTTNVTTAAIGKDVITVTVVKTIPESTTTLLYSGADAFGDGTHIHRQVELDTGTTDTFTPPESIGGYFPYVLSYPLAITAITYVDGVEAGRIETSVTLTLPDDCAPELTVSAAPCWASTSPAATAFPAYIQAHSGATFTFTANAKYGAGFEEQCSTLSIEGYIYLGNAGEAQELEALTHLPFAGSGEIPWTATVTDTRGLTATKTGTITVTPWEPPTIERFEVYRVTETDTEAIDGTYIRASVRLAAASILVNGTERNSLQYHILYRELSDTPSEWSTADELAMSTLTTDNAFVLKKNGAAIGGGGLDADGNDRPFNEMLGYEFQLVVSDIYGESTAQAAIPSAQQFQDIDEVTGNMGFGGNAPESTDDAAYRFYRQTDFPSGVQIEAQRYGWHAGDSLEIDANTAIAGYLTGGSKDCRALLCVGQPIFAERVALSGAAVLRGIKGYLDGMAYSTGVAVGATDFTFAAEIANAKAGMINLSVTKATAFGNATNNTPATINGAGNQSLLLTFM